MTVRCPNCDTLHENDKTPTEHEGCHKGEQAPENPTPVDKKKGKDKDKE